VAACTNPFLVESRKISGEGETIVEKNTLPDMAKGAFFLLVDFLSLRDVRPGKRNQEKKKNRKPVDHERGPGVRLCNRLPGDSPFK
jgi:hypothetical protein